jgi:cell division septation protein DedD
MFSMEREPEQQPEISEEGNARNELVLDNWKLVLIFFVGLVICTIFFAAGLIVGRHQPRVADSVPATSLESLRSYSTLPPTTQAENRSRAASPAPSKQTVMEMNPASPGAASMAEDPSIGTLVAPSTTLLNMTETAAPAVSEPVPEPKVSPSREPDALRTSTSSGSVFRVQVAAMKTLAEAQAVVSKLKQKGFDCFIVPPTNDAFYRVQMGDFSERAAAQELILKLQQAGERPVLKRQQP